MSIPVPAETPDPNIDDPELPVPKPEEPPSPLMPPVIEPPVGDPPSGEPRQFWMTRFLSDSLTRRGVVGPASAGKLLNGTPRF
ncbi:hypothetical protein JN403_16915 [Pseudomonas sp. 15A4]|uniref:hypothetical protein n=1 Tax=Pseudomonas sp. 15A4 TaxID=2804761 RepID=UPI001966D244|nr:hypothetical protein [Pseudomonas sp. 15A4]QSB21917.1 hypothetical protein JN403_16915 [Pseudomonas sp. 15A4]